MPMAQTTFLQTLLPSRRLRLAARVARVLLGLVASFWLLFGVSWALLHGWIVPRISEFRPRLEAVASKALGVPVRIGQISARSQGLMPSFELRDVSLLDAQGRAALRLPSVQAALTPSSLWGLGFEQLVVDRPELDIRRSSDGKIHVAGLDFSQSRSDGSSAFFDWFFSQPELVVRGGTVRWTDELRGAPPLALTQVDWVMRNPGKRHLMRLDATPPAGWGERFSLRGMLRQPLLSTGAAQWSQWAGQLYADFSRVDVSQLKQYATLEHLGVDVLRGEGAVRAWAEVTGGRVSGGTVDVALLEVNTQLGKKLQPLALESVTGRFGGRQLAHGFELHTENLRFATRDGLRWPGGNLALLHTDAEGRKAGQTRIKADKLDLAALALIADRLPLEAATHGLIASFAPKGLVETLEAQWQGPLSAPLTFSARGRVSGLELAARPLAGDAAAAARLGRPGVQGASVDFNLSHEGGQAKVAVAQGWLDLPGVFEDSRVLLDQLSMDTQWKQTGRQLELQLRNIQFANADAAGQAQASWRTAEADASPAAAGAREARPDARFPGVLELQGSLSRGDGSRVHRYLPLVLPKHARHYVRDAVLQGQLSEVKFKVKGDLRKLPFADPRQGEFQISAKVSKGHFDYVPAALVAAGSKPWPALNDLQGELLFNRNAMEVNGAPGRVAGLAGLQLVHGSARIPDLGRGTTVEVKLDLKGPLSEALAFVSSSPVARMTREALAKTLASGAADYGVRLVLPLAALDKSTVQGTVSLPGNDVQFTPDAPLLGRLKGVVAFSETGFRIQQAQARLLGGEIRFDGGMRPAAGPRAGPASGEAAEPELAIRAQGTLTAEGLRQSKNLGVISRMAQNASGSAAYAATLGFRRGVAEVTLTSSLQGMALNLPAPLSKAAESALPLRFESALLPDSLAAGQKLRDQLSLSIGRVASMVYVRDRSGPQARVLRGSIAVGLEAGESAPVLDNEVTANVRLASVDLDGWGKILKAPAAPPSAAGAADASASGAAGNAAAYLPTVMAIRARELKLEGRQLNNVVVGGSREGLNWRASIDATELNGYVEFRQASSSGAGRLYARLARLSLAPGTAREVEALLEKQPASMPALDIVVEDLELRGKKLGRVEIEAANRAVVAREDSVREWRLNKFNVILPEAVFTATGQWAQTNVPNTASLAGLPAALRPPSTATPPRRTVMNFRLDINDSGELLERFGMHGVVRRGKGRLEGQVGWLGSPLSLDYPSLNGQFNVNVESGQFLKADPGIAKLLGVLSLQSLPRRLTLDFRDVFSEGFAFDFVRGDVTIAQGLALTNNLQMKGVNAAVLMEGQADIARETQDLKVVVVPEINAGTASLIATVINPAIGLGTFLAQVFLRRPLMEAATQEFHIDGTWSDPKVSRVERKSALSRSAAPELEGARPP